MAMILKVLKVNGVRSVRKKDSWGKRKLYPNGTTRKVKVFSLYDGIYKTLQKTKIKIASDPSGEPYTYYNSWKFIDRHNLIN